MMLELRCSVHLYCKVEIGSDDHLEPEDIRYQVRCHQCSRKQHRDVFHTWTLARIIEAQNQGHDVVWPDGEPGTATPLIA